MPRPLRTHVVAALALAALAAASPAAGQPRLDVVAAQVADARSAEKALGLRLHDVESGPFLFHTTYDPRSAEFSAFVEAAARVFEIERRLFSFLGERPIWPGKLQVYVFRKREEFRRFAAEWDAAPGAAATAGYYSESTAPDGRPRILVALAGAQEEVFAHELAHAFLSSHAGGRGRVPAWLNEGLAEVARTRALAAAGRADAEAEARRLARELLAGPEGHGSLKALVARAAMPATDTAAYALAYSVVDYMLALDPAKLARLVRLIAAPGRPGALPATPDAQALAFERAYGIPLFLFESRWREHVAQNH